MADETTNNLPLEAEVPAPETPAEQPKPEEGSSEHNVAPDPSKLKDEIEELRKQRQKAEEDAIYWRKQKAEARGEFFRERKEPPAEPPKGIGVEPQPGDFDDYNKYVAAITDHRVRIAKAEWDREAEQRSREQSQQQRQESLHAKLQEGFAKYPDFEEVAFDRTATHITQMIVDILADCEAPADLAYYLAKNRIEGVAISRMTPIQAARAIAKIEAKLTS